MKTVFQTELLHLLRDPLSLTIALAMPIFLLFLIGYSIEFEMREYPFAVYDMDKSKESIDYINTIDNTEFFKLDRHVEHYQDLLNLLDSGTVGFGIVIPTDFSEKISRQEPVNIQTLVDSSYVNNTLFILNYLKGINTAYSSSLVTEFLKQRGVEHGAINLSIRSWFNQELREFTFKITGVFSITIMGFVPILSALAIVRERESGSIQQVFASPVRPFEYISGKMLPYCIFLTLDYLFVVIFGIWFFDLPWRGSLVALFMATFLMVLICVLMGFFISTIARTQLSAMMLAIVFTLMPALIYSDAITPIHNSPGFFHNYSSIFPAKFYTAICRSILVKGASITSVFKDTWPLLVQVAALFIICAWRMKKIRA
jgi:ABC-2 type transport system permease protein